MERGARGSGEALAGENGWLGRSVKIRALVFYTFSRNLYQIV